MTFLKKMSMALVAVSMVAAPVAASAQLAVPTSQTDRDNLRTRAAGNAGYRAYIIGLFGLAALIAAGIIAADGTNSRPTSP